MLLRLLMLLPLAVVLCTGCSIQRLEALVQAANDRQWKTCFKTSGAYGLFASASVEIAAGGATIDECRGTPRYRAVLVREDALMEGQLP